MSIDYAAIALEASEAIASVQDVSEPDKGKGTIIRAGATVGPSYDPTFGPYERHDCNVLLGLFGSREIDGTLILATDIKVTIAASDLTIEPTPADTFEQTGQTYEIINVDPLKPAGVAVLWILQCRSN